MPRCRFVATVDLDGWRLKTYAITMTGARPRAELVAAARCRATTALPARPDHVGAFGVGFMILHDLVGCAAGSHGAGSHGGRDGAAPDGDDQAGQCLALIDWWMRPDTLYQRAFIAPAGRPQALQPLTTAAIGGLAELAITAHEQQAWRTHVLRNPAGRNLDAYLADVLRESN